MANFPAPRMAAADPMPDPLAKISEGPATAVLAPTIVKGKMGTGAGAGAAKTMERHKKAKQRTRTGFIWKKKHTK